MHANSAKLQFTTNANALANWTLSPEAREHSAALVLAATEHDFWPDCFVPDLVLIDAALEALTDQPDTLPNSIEHIKQARRNLYSYFAQQSYGDEAFALEATLLSVLTKAVDPDMDALLRSAEALTVRVCPLNALRPKGTPEQKVQLTRLLLWAHAHFKENPVAGRSYADDELHSLLEVALRDISLPTNPEPEF